MRSRLVFLGALMFLSCEFTYGAATKTLDIYFIDVEGGQSTLLVTPGGESLLIDTGWAADGSPGAKPGEPSQSRDARRIAAAAHDAGINRIDYLQIHAFPHRP